MAATYEPIESITLGTAAATVTLGSGGTIPQTFTDLRLVITAKNSTAAHQAMKIRFNGDTGSNYSYTRLLGTGLSAASDRSANNNGIDIGFLPNSASNFGTVILDIMSYANGNVYKSVLCSWESQGGLSGSQYVTREVGLWRSTAAITSALFFFTNDTVAGSTFSLYGIQAA